MSSAQHVHCQSCGVNLEMAASQRAGVCPYCLSPTIIARPPAHDCPAPRFVMGFRQSQAEALRDLRGWTRSLRWSFRRGDLNRAKVEDLRGIYIPAYLFSALAEADYQVEIGEYYQRKNNKGQHKQATEWCNLAGTYKAYLSDVLVSASQGVDNNLLQHVEPFDLSLLRRYQPQIISGWIAEDPSRSQADCRELAQEEAKQSLRGKILGFLPGDERRALRFKPRFAREALDLCLLPVWSLGLRYAPDQPPMRVLVNGQTGKVFGFAPWSKLKIGFALALVLGVVALGVLGYLFGGGA